jgi:ferrous iron transport protein B
VLVHPVWGWVILLGIMAGLFMTIFSVAKYPMDWITAGFDWLGGQVKAGMPPGDLRALITEGIIGGVGGVLVFLPQILLLFFFLGLMENTGYLARVSFMMDRLMSGVGLSGKAFIPLLSSYACAIPGIMATRTMESARDRLITILVAPITSCSARLPVYFMLIALMLPAGNGTQKALVMLGLYVLSILGVYAFAWVFNRTLKKTGETLMVLELPSYQRPSWREVLMQMMDRGKIFLRRAGTVILGLSILLWALKTYPKSDSEDDSEQLAHSAAGRMGKFIEPVIEPLGYDWEMGVGLVASFAAREMFVSTMSIIYLGKDKTEEGDTVRQKMAKEKRADGTPAYNLRTCLSLLVFYVFAMQCLSTVAITRRETNSWRWPIFQVAYLTGFAYLAALATYQLSGFFIP